jgi:ion channel
LAQHAPVAKPTAHDRFGRLLVVLLALFVVTGFPAKGALRVADVVLAFSAMFIAIRATGLAGPRWVSLTIGFGVAGTVLVVLAPAGSEATQGIVSIGIALAVLGALIAVLARVMEHDTVGLETLAGALCGYLLIGFLFGSLYTAADAFGRAHAFGQPVPRTDFSYFSFVTLTTLGYGDLAPKTDFVQRLAVLEAMIGQIYLATTIARLVSLFRSQAAE